MIRIFILLLSCLILLSCGGKKTDSVSDSAPQTNNDIPQFLPPTFSFIEDYVSDSFKIGEVSVRIPAGWSAVSRVLLNQMQTGAANDSGQFRHQPMAAYSMEPSCRMLLSFIPEAAPTPDEFVWWARDLALVMKRVRTDATFQEAWIMLNGIRAMFLSARDNGMFQIKIVLETQPPVSIDYSFPTASSLTEDPKIRSSIASVKRVSAAG